MVFKKNVPYAGNDGFILVQLEAFFLDNKTNEINELPEQLELIYVRTEIIILFSVFCLRFPSSYHQKPISYFRNV